MVINLHMANGVYAFCEQKTPNQKARTVEAVNDCDFKTAIAQGKKAIPKGEVVEILKVISNFYGWYVLVLYKGVRYHLEPRELEWLN